MTEATLHKCLRNLGMPESDIPTGMGIVGLYPWIVMDWQYQIFNTHIAIVPCRHLTKKEQTQWSALNHKLFGSNGLLFRGLTDDEREEVTDAMDEMETELSNDLVRLVLAVKSAVPSEDTDLALRIGYGYACSALAIAAQDLYSILYRNKRTIIPKQQPVRGYRLPETSSLRTNGAVLTKYDLSEPKTNADINGILEKSLYWVGRYAKDHGINQVECGLDIKQLRTTLLNHTVSWATKTLAA